MLPGRHRMTDGDKIIPVTMMLPAFLRFFLTEYFSRATLYVGLKTIKGWEAMRINILISAVLLSLLAAGNAAAVDKTPQQEKMTVCNKQAGEKALKGDDRKAFMSNCLKKDHNMAGMTPQQMKMKTCNADATQKALKGDERKTFMSACLKKS